MWNHLCLSTVDSVVIRFPGTCRHKVCISVDWLIDQLINESFFSSNRSNCAFRLTEWSSIHFPFIRKLITKFIKLKSLAIEIAYDGELLAPLLSLDKRLQQLSLTIISFTATDLVHLGEFDSLIRLEKLIIRCKTLDLGEFPFQNSNQCRQSNLYISTQNVGSATSRPRTRWNNCVESFLTQKTCTLLTTSKKKDVGPMSAHLDQTLSTCCAHFCWPLTFFSFVKNDFFVLFDFLLVFLTFARQLCLPAYK